MSSHFPALMVSLIWLVSVPVLLRGGVPPESGTTGTASEVGQSSRKAPPGSEGLRLAGNGTRSGAARPVGGQASLLGLSRAVHMFFLDTGRMPLPAEGLNALLTRPAGVKNWKGPYITIPSGRSPLTDPWGNVYRFVDTTPTSGSRPTFSIRSNGPDGVPDTADDLSIDG